MLVNGTSNKKKNETLGGSGVACALWHTSNALNVIMIDIGLADILASTFVGVGKMLTGKKFPMNTRAMRMVAEELLLYRDS